MDTDALNIAQKYAEIIKDNFDFQKLILFGSYAKGNPQEDSDIAKKSHINFSKIF